MSILYGRASGLPNATAPFPGATAGVISTFFQEVPKHWATSTLSDQSGTTAWPFTGAGYLATLESASSEMPDALISQHHTYRPKSVRRS